MSGKISQFVKSLYAKQNGRNTTLVHTGKEGGTYKVVHRSNKTGLIDMISRHSGQNSDGTVTRTDTDAYGNPKRSLTFNPNDGNFKTIYKNQLGFEITENEFNNLDK